MVVYLNFHVTAPGRMTGAAFYMWYLCPNVFAVGRLVAGPFRIFPTFHPIGPLIIFQTMIEGVVVFHLCHEQIESRQSHAQSEQMEQCGRFIAAQIIK